MKGKFHPVSTHTIYLILFAEMYRWYQIMICLLKFDFFFFIGVTMQVRKAKS